VPLIRAVAPVRGRPRQRLNRVYDVPQGKDQSGVPQQPISRDRCRLSAEIPSLAVANSQHAVNHTVSGVRVRSKIVPAVTDVRCPHAAHMIRPSPSRQPRRMLHSRQMNPCGQRGHSR
jgi:hypothetical protein